MSCTDSTRLKWIDIQYGTSWLKSARCELCISYSGEEIRNVRYEWYHCLESNLFTRVDLKTVVIRGWVDTSLDKNQDWYVSSVMKVISQRLQLKVQVYKKRLSIDSSLYACYIVVNPIYRLTSAWIVWPYPRFDTWHGELTTKKMRRCCVYLKL